MVSIVNQTVQLTPEQHRFELCETTLTRIVFNKYSTTRSAVGLVRGWLNPPMRNRGYGGLSMGPEHQRILVSQVGPGTNPQWIPRDNWIVSIYLKSAKRVDLSSFHQKEKILTTCGDGCYLNGYGFHFTIYTNIKTLHNMEEE